MLMDRITGSRRPSPDTVSLIDSQKEKADSGVEPGFGRIGVFTAGNEGTMGAGVEGLLPLSDECDGTVVTGGRVGWGVGVTLGAVVAVTRA